ncbi:hypothetical protein ACP4OV_011872 [Aristida adscensionis]
MPPRRRRRARRSSAAPAARAPPAFGEELVEEILFRIPPDDPASLARAALVCRQWRRLVAGAAFRRRYREFHRAPPMLGFLYNRAGGFVGFTSTSSFHPRRDAGGRRWPAGGWTLDARHGRVLFASLVSTSTSHLQRLDLVVLHPITGAAQTLHSPPFEYSHFVAALLCAAPGCDHLDCDPGGAFTVVFLGTDESEMLTSACVYSSEAGAWSSTISVHHPLGCVLGATSAFTGNAVYFSCYRYGIARILEYHLSAEPQQLSVIGLPPGCKARNGRPMTGDDGRLAFAAVQESKLYIWAMEDACGKWEQRRIIELNRVLPFCARSIETDFVSSADAFGVVIVRRGNFLFTIDLKSCQVRRKVYKGAEIYNVVPYMSFCTPALGAAFTGKEPTAGDSVS